MGDHMNYVMTLANSIIGVGVLAMPFCFQKCGIVLAILMILLSSVISRLSCHFLLKASIHARRKNFEFLAFHALGATGKLLVELGIIGFLMGTVIAFFVVVGDLGPEIIAKTLDIESSQSLRSWLLIFITIGCVLPLGLLRNVDSLTSICTVTIGFYVCLVIKVMLESVKHISDSDWIDKVELWNPSGILQCLPIFSMALFCQTQIFEIYSSMENASLDKMNLVVKWAINICAVVYILVGSFGYIAFCHQHFSGNILLSFSPTPMSDIIKMGFVLSVAFSFPLAIFPCRASLYSLLFRRVTSQHEVAIVMPERRFRCLTVLIVAVGLAVAMAIPCIELVLGLVGSTMGVAVCVLLPAACYVKVVTRQNNERLLAQGVLIIGVLIMVFGTYANLYAMDEGSSQTVFDKNSKNMKYKQDDVKSVDEKILLPLNDLKYPLDKINDELNIKEQAGKKLIPENIEAPLIKKMQEVRKENLLESPPFPVEKDELVEVINKESFPIINNDDKVELNDNKLSNNKVNAVLKGNMPLNKSPINVEFNMEEISKDAIRKEDQELRLNKASGNEDRESIKENIINMKSLGAKPADGPIKKQHIELDRPSDSKNAEEKIIQDIKKEKMKLDNEFQRKVVENMNLIASMNMNKKQKKDDVGFISKEALNAENEVSDKKHMKRDETVIVDQELKFVQNVIKINKTSTKSNKSRSIHNQSGKNKTMESMKDKKIITENKKKQEEASFNDKSNPEKNVESHVPKEELNQISDDIAKSKYKSANKEPNLPMVLQRNYTSEANSDTNKLADKFVQREILQVVTEKISHPVNNKENTERTKRDLKNEPYESNLDQNCIKSKELKAEEVDEPKIFSADLENIVNSNDIQIKSNTFGALKPSSRDLKSISDKSES